MRSKFLLSDDVAHRFIPRHISNEGIGALPSGASHEIGSIVINGVYCNKRDYTAQATYRKFPSRIVTICVVVSCIIHYYPFTGPARHSEPLLALTAFPRGSFAIHVDVVSHNMAAVLGSDAHTDDVFLVLGIVFRQVNGVDLPSFQAVVRVSL